MFFVLTRDDPFVCIDIDKIDLIKDISFLKDFKNTYQEVSTSGNGLHIFLKGDIPKNINNQENHVEMYKENKCIAMTADVLDESNLEIKELQSALDKLYKNYAPRQSTIEKIEKFKSILESNSSNEVPSIDKVIETMCKYNKSASDLFYGNFLSEDHSKDDFRLILFLNSFTHGNKEMMREIFLKSALNRSDDKSKRKNEQEYLRYLDKTIDKVIDNCKCNFWKYDYHRKKRGDLLE